MTDRQSLAALEGRLRATDAVGGVVRAVWAIAQAQLPRVALAGAEASAYLDWVDGLVARVVGPMAPPGHAPGLVVALGPERGFCGSLAREMAAVVPASGALGVVGRRFADAVGAQRAVDFVLPGPGSAEEIEPVAEAVAAEVLRRAGDAPVALLHPRGGGASPARAVLLPGRARRDAPRPRPEHYSPLPVLVAHALREHATGRLLVGLAETLHAEVSARVRATDHARHAIDDRREALDRALRVLRQEQITEELRELASASTAPHAEHVVVEQDGEDRLAIRPVDAVRGLVPSDVSSRATSRWHDS